MMSLKQGKNVTTNKKVKLLLAQFLSDQIQFCKPCPANQSLIVFSSGLSVKDVIRTESAAKEILKSYF